MSLHDLEANPGMSDYEQSPQHAPVLNMGSVGTSSSYRSGSQQGSDFGFVNPQSPSIGGMLQGTQVAGSSSRTTPAGVTSYKPQLGELHASLPRYEHAYNSPLLSAGHRILPQHRSSMSSLPDGQSPLMGHDHRLSMSGNGPYAVQERHGSLGAASDTTSQEGQRAHGNFCAEHLGESPFGHNSNESINVQDQGDDSSAKNNDSSAPPPWSELKTKAGKERKRLPLACIACRRKKIRCSGEKPACKHCLRSRIPCVYKVATRKAAPRTDYMAMLDRRLKRMEDRVIKIIPKAEQGMIKDTGRASVRPPLPPPPPKSAGSSKKRAAEQAFNEELDDWANVQSSSKDSEANAQPDAEEILKPQDAEELSLLREGADKLPPKELQEHLSEVFFDYVYGQSYPLLHKPSFIRKLAQDQVPPVLMLAVCAISARFSSHPAVRTEPAFLRGEDWARAAREIALRRYDTPNITILIVYLILGLHEFGTCQGGRSWMLGGMAQRMAYALQLHKDLDHDPKRQMKDKKSELTFTDREIRRRTMWSCFLMDRFNSSGTDRPIFVGEQHIRAQLPIKEHLFQMEINGPTEDLEGNVPNPVDPDVGQMADAKQNMGVAAYLIRIVAIWGKVISYMNLGGKDRDEYPVWAEQSTFQSLKRDAATWIESLPTSLRFSIENLQNHASEKIANQFLLLHIMYNQIILFVNLFALPTSGARDIPPIDIPSDFRSEAAKEALVAANQISALIHESMDHLVVAPVAGYCAYLSSTVHINGAFSGNAALEASSKQNLAWNVKYLTKMKKHWGMFHFLTETLRDLYRKHADAARLGVGVGTGDDKTDREKQPVFQYGDWFDRYPHGVSGADYEEPQANIKKEPGADAVLGQKSDLQTVEEFFSKLSPPSRAAQQHNNNAQKKTAKKRRSQSESKGSSSTAARQQQLRQQHSADSQEDLEQNQTVSRRQQLQQHLQRNILGHDQNYIPNHPFTHEQQRTSAYQPGFQAPTNPLLIPSHQNQALMSELDRQMVLSSYAGIDPHDPTNLLHLQNPQNNLVSPSMNPHLSNLHQPPFTDLDFSALAVSAANDGNGNAHLGGYWSDPSTAWFMPFNMEPPGIGEDHTPFGAGRSRVAWGHGAGEFGGLAHTGLTPTGLTPRGSIQLDQGPHGQGDEGGGSVTGMEGLGDL